MGIRCAPASFRGLWTMVSSPKDMSSFEGLPDRVESLERKIDVLAASLDARFDGVDLAIAEQRAFTAFVHEQIEGRVGQIDGRLGQIDGRVGQIEGRFGQMESHFDRLERKLDGFVDTQSRANEIAERRL